MLTDLEAVDQGRSTAEAPVPAVRKLLSVPRTAWLRWVLAGVGLVALAARVPGSGFMIE